MVKKGLTCVMTAITVIICFFSLSGQHTEAKVLWGGLELKKGTIGKVIVVKETPLYEYKQDRLTMLRTLKKGQQYRVYSSKKIQGTLFYSLGGNAYVRKSDHIQYVSLSAEQFALLVKQSLKGEYKLVSGNQQVTFFIETQKGNHLFGWYFYAEDDPLPLDGTIEGNVVTLRAYFDDRYDQILDSISYLEQYKVPKDELEDIGLQLVNNDDYYMQLQFTIANDPNSFNGQFRFVNLLLNGRYDVVDTELGDPFPIKVKKMD
ncbi:hypothetical protein AT864_03119 [Anoxybacillus sp. P3H1B]|uniref:SLAP domain-containing protein n=1 Tax=Anoxybacillus sp. P3H1B TaxID=1769293 RepID=UPI0007972375|nr:SLAP domain-containing protein [Anoxybacillus sp. P3H1B]KXG08423.1 hypothetical protein AT864_03119 [Anoxybacillus sp. P3H1B]